MLGKVFCIVRLLALKLRFRRRLSIKSLRQVIRADTEIHIGKEGLLYLDSVNVNTNVHLVCERGEMKIGSGVIFNRNCIVTCWQKIEIGDNCLFGPNVCIYDHDHAVGPDGVLPNEFICSDIIIEEGCWIGAGVVILKGTHIGKNTVISAGTVVKGNIPSDSIIMESRETRTIPLSFLKRMYSNGR